MNAKFTEITAAADYIGPGAIELPMHHETITDLVRRRGLFGQRIKHVPATGHPSRFFEDVAGQPTRVERSVPLKALVAQINYHLDETMEAQASQFAYLQAKDLNDTVEGVLRTHDVALWNGTDTSLSQPTTAQYFGAADQIAAGGNTTTIPTNGSIVHGLKCAVAEMVAAGSRPSAIYANPVLLNLIDREMKTEFAVTLPTRNIAGDFAVKIINTQAGELPLIPDWTLGYTGTPGSGSAILPAYIVTEDLIEYHWLSDPNPRVFQLGRPGSLASQYVVVKFGGLAVKNAGTAHRQVLVDR